MASFAFPSSRGVLEAFIERIRYSPSARVDIDWLVRCLGISQRNNAGRTLDWLQVIGLINNKGTLTNRGKAFLSLPHTRRYKRAASEALGDLLDRGQLEDLREGRLRRAGLRGNLRERYGVGASAANKAIVGICALAEAAGDAPVATSLRTPRLQVHVPVAPTVDFASEKRAILKRFELFTAATGGIGGWLKESTPDITFERLVRIPMEPLTHAQLNQLLTLAHAAPVSAPFFSYYWLSQPPHPYDLTSIPGYHNEWADSLAIFDIEQLHWGLYRFYVDSLLFFGNVRSAYQCLRGLNQKELSVFFLGHMFDPELMAARGPALSLQSIKRDDRYLISEMACKSYEPASGHEVSLIQALTSAYEQYRESSSDPVILGHLLSDEDEFITKQYPGRQAMFKFAAAEILDSVISSEADLEAAILPVKERFVAAREAGVHNTEMYLSAVGDMDVYVATSMRSRSDFHNMANFCDEAFQDQRLRQYHLRYFDPTVSAATNHQDKGLIECLMVKCAKLLVYTAGEKDSFGKDAEAAMALSLGKPVIFYCDTEEKLDFFQNVHPLSRLIDFQTGVAVGSMVTGSVETVIQLLERTVTNTMQYVIEQERPGYFVLKEHLTNCVVRLQTNDELLRETFWNHYHGSSRERVVLGESEEVAHPLPYRLPDATQFDARLQIEEVPRIPQGQGDRAQEYRHQAR